MRGITRGGEKGRTTSQGQGNKAWDHDPPPARKWTPLGILVLATGMLTIVFGECDTSDFWADGLKLWWLSVRGTMSHIKRLVIYLDNGPNNAGNRTQWLVRLIQLADWSGLEIKLVYYPAYHSKYNPIERCWGTLEKKWGATLLNSLKVMLQEARRMTWEGRPPTVKRLHGDYPDGGSPKRSVCNALRLYPSTISPSSRYRPSGR
jgi:hypothetical protein